MVTWVHWHTEPALIGGVLLAVWAYLLAVGPLRARIAPGTAYPRGPLAWFIAAVVSFYLAVGSPLDAMGEAFLFSAHMVQHNILMYLTAVFAVLAVPGWMVDAFLEQFPRAGRVFRFVMHPLSAGFSFTFVFCIWHFPVLYEAALHDKVLHMIEHLTMLGASIQMFWPILNRSVRMGRMNWGLQILYVFVLMVAQIPLFAILTFSPEVLYPTYELAPRITFLDPLADQVLGGLIMKVANMVISLLLIGRAFYFWNRMQEDPGPAVAQVVQGMQDPVRS